MTLAVASSEENILKIVNKIMEIVYALYKKKVVVISKII